MTNASIQESIETMTNATAVKAKIETVTPAKAEKWLETNVDNRDIDEGHVATCAADMLADRWLINGEAIKFDAEGLLIDGQHRLSACVAAGKSFKSVVVRGIERTARLTMDVGKGRKFSDHLKITYGLSEAKVAATVATHSLLFNVEEGRIGNQLSGGNGAVAEARGASRQELDAWFVEYRGTIEAATLQANRLNHSKNLIPLTTRTTAAITFAAVHAGLGDEIDEFVEVFRRGREGHPVNALREILINEKMNPNVKIPTRRKTALVIRAWNKQMESATVKRLHVSAEDVDANWTILGPSLETIFPFNVLPEAV